MQKKSLFIGLFLILGISIFCSFIFQVTVHKCLWWNCAPTRNIVVLEDLNIPKNMFPEASLVKPLSRPRDIFPAVEAGITSNYWGEGKVTTYWVRRFATIQKATEVYENNLENHTKDYTFDLTIETRLHADAYFSGCGINSFSGQFHCKVLLRYSEYVVSLTSSTDITFRGVDLLKIVDYLDQLFAKELRGCRIRRRCFHLPLS